ncbi:Mitochondrial distribution and morphology protein 31, mitochondrial precursor [Recurvomyces mirabilis]|uniref:Mitochondrial distribution and morphology protein 31, mitochondrial n=1 Tax=Recurvomyces mirabilis TaxID=574656 RepID=A0AAE0WT51_9PEZI|nr:Mitochondrial distribution and morphology protein 31, mitochondrial precursor [Recurvomyces mirabilis]KAK5157425.1 Mitochondrial distribution and morphology protein 31, mitochondrial precursor [Recurvomyces mirabilis]
MLQQRIYQPHTQLSRYLSPPSNALSRALIEQRRWKHEDVRSAKASVTEQMRKASEQYATRGGGSKQHNLLDRLPHLHRPTKEELLAAATGFWHRLQIRFKWFSIRSARPFNSDEIFAFVSWIFWGHVIWIIIGTTTFVSLGIWAINTVFAQETLAGWVGNYLTKSSGVKIVFESAIVPTWRDGVITFNNVFVSRRPGQQDRRQRSVSKGSSTTAAAAAAEAALAEKRRAEVGEKVDDGNYSQFDVTIDKVNVTLSFTKWFNGRGLLHDVEIRGVRGVIDRTHVFPTGEKRDPKSYRHEHHMGDFEIDNFKVDDVLLTVYQPKDFRPFTVSIFNCELPRLRKQWLFYDFMSATNLSGSFDDSLFTIHPRQVHGMSGAQLVNGATVDDAEEWKKHSRFRIDGLSIDHLNRGVDGPFSWIQEGNVDIVADIMIPHDQDDSIAKVVHDLYDRLETTVTTAAQQQPSGHRNPDDNIIRNDQVDVNEGANHEVSSTPQAAEDDRLLIMDLRVHLNDVRATIPLFNNNLSYVNNALVRPIVAYINGRHTFIPISCRIVKTHSEFDGSWTVFDSGLMNDLSRETYGAFVKDIHDQRQQRRRIKKVGFWGLSVVAQALFLGLAGQLA